MTIADSPMSTRPTAESSPPAPAHLVHLDPRAAVRGRTPTPGALPGHVRDDRADGDETAPYMVRFEGVTQMTVEVRFGLIFVWYGDDLANPDRPFPTLFGEPYPTPYMTSPPSVFENTHVMDFVENGSDNLHFSAVHLWDHSRIYDHVVSPDTITLQQDTAVPLWAVLAEAPRPAAVEGAARTRTHPGLRVPRAGARGRRCDRQGLTRDALPGQPHAPRVRTELVSTSPSPSRPRRFPQSHSGSSPGHTWPVAVRRGRTGHGRLHQQRVRHRPDHLDEPPTLTHPAAAALGGAPPGGHPLGPDVLPTGLRVVDQHRSGRCTRRDGTSWTTWTDSVGPRCRRYELDGHQTRRVPRRSGPTAGVPRTLSAPGRTPRPRGRIEDGCLRCPFHAFYFDPDGRCVGRNPQKRSSPIDLLAIDVVEHRVVGRRVDVLL